jgi:uncharacterized protein
MRCPRCEGVLLIDQPGNDPDAEVQRCRACGGLWFGPGSLTRVLAVAAEDLKVLDDAERTALTCPRCAKPLHRFQYPQTLVRVDMCRRCAGLWLDAGELREIKAVRKHLAQTGELETFAPVTGLKGALLRFIDTAIGSMARGDGD